MANDYANAGSCFGTYEAGHKSCEKVCLVRDKCKVHTESLKESVQEREADFVEVLLVAMRKKYAVQDGESDGVKGSLIRDGDVVIGKVFRDKMRVYIEGKGFSFLFDGKFTEEHMKAILLLYGSQ